MKNGESYSKKTDEKMDQLLQKITDTVGSQLQGINTTIVKMKEEGDDRYKQNNERIANMEKKISDSDEKCETRTDEPIRPREDQNHRQKLQQQDSTVKHLKHRSNNL